LFLRARVSCRVDTRANRRTRRVATVEEDPLFQPIDGARELEVPLGERADRVTRQAQANVVPSVNEDVGMVIGGFGHLGDAVDERDRRREIAEVTVADDLMAFPSPGALVEMTLDVFVAQLSHPATLTVPRTCTAIPGDGRERRSRRLRLERSSQAVAT